MRRRLVSAIAAVALASGLLASPLSGVASAQVECAGTIGGIADTPGAPGMVIPVGPGGTDTNTFYIDVRHLGSDDYLWSIWIYQESGRKANLQRGTDALDGPLGPALELTTAAANYDDPCKQDTAANRDVAVV